VNWLKAYHLGIDNNMVTKSNLHIQAKIQQVKTVPVHESKILDNIVKSSTLSNPRTMSPVKLPVVHTVDTLNPHREFFY